MYGRFLASAKISILRLMLQELSENGMVGSEKGTVAASPQLGRKKSIIHI
jgi:hypothetical protein